MITGNMHTQSVQKTQIKEGKIQLHRRKNHRADSVWKEKNYSASRIPREIRQMMKGKRG